MTAGLALAFGSALGTNVAFLFKQRGAVPPRLRPRTPQSGQRVRAPAGNRSRGQRELDLDEQPLVACRRTDDLVHAAVGHREPVSGLRHGPYLARWLFRRLTIGIPTVPRWSSGRGVR